MKRNLGRARFTGGAAVAQAAGSSRSKAASRGSALALAACLSAACVEGSPHAADGGAGGGAKSGETTADGATRGGPTSGATGGAAPTSSTGPSVDLCPDGFPRGAAGEPRVVQAFSPPLEGVAVCPNGEVFVSQPTEARILRVPLDGSAPEVWTTLTGRQPLGMDCASDGALYVADFGTNDATVLRIAQKGEAGMLLPKVPGDKGYEAMNGVAAVTGVGVYATDASNTLSGRIVLFTEPSPGVFEAHVVKKGLPFPNDVAGDRATRTLDVTLTLSSQVLSYPLEADGALGDKAVTWSGLVAVDAIDGVAIAEDQDRYVAHYLQGKVRRVSDGETVASVEEPRSLAFRGGTLLVTTKDGLHAVELGVCGAPR